MGSIWLLTFEKVSEALTGVAQWLGVVLQSERSLVRFPVWAHAWVEVWSLVRVYTRGNRWMFLSRIYVLLPLFPSLISNYF